MGPLIVIAVWFLLGLIFFALSQLLHKALKKIKIFDSKLITALFFWPPLLLPIIATGLLLAGMNGWPAAKPNIVFNVIYNTAPNNNVELHNAYSEFGTDYYVNYLSHSLINEQYSDFFARVNFIEIDQSSASSLSPTPKWWLGNKCRNRKVYASAKTPQTFAYLCLVDNIIYSTSYDIE